MPHQQCDPSFRSPSARLCCTWRISCARWAAVLGTNLLGTNLLGTPETRCSIRSARSRDFFSLYESTLILSRRFFVSLALSSLVRSPPKTSHRCRTTHQAGLFRAWSLSSFNAGGCCTSAPSIWATHLAVAPAKRLPRPLHMAAQSAANDNQRPAPPQRQQHPSYSTCCP